MAFCFFAGICLCRCFQLVVLPLAIARIMTVVSICVIGLCLAVDSTGVFAVFGFAGLIFSLAYQTGIANTLVTSRPSMFLGKISFSFYLIHIIPLDFFLWWTETAGATWNPGLVVKLAILVALAGGCIFLAAVTYQFVEKPFQQLGRHITRRVGRSKPPDFLQARADRTKSPFHPNARMKTARASIDSD
jgi:peptidoglycan/LPS O-acetylase OafA/YrhL